MADGPPEPVARAEAENRALRARIAATDEVLRAIAAQPTDPRPVFDLIAGHVRALAGATTASILEFDGTLLHRAADVGYRPEVLAALRAGFPRAPGPDFVPGRTVLAGEVVHVADLATEPGVFGPARQMGARSYLGIPLRHERRIVGVLGLGRADVGAFDDTAVELAHSFAEQAVIAMASARLLAEQGEALARQTATAELLQVINASPGELAPVFATILEKAHMLCGAAVGALFLAENGLFRAVATRGYPAAVEAVLRERRPAGARVRTLIDGARFHQTTDIRDGAVPGGLDLVVAAFGVRTSLIVPLREDGRLIGWITANRLEVRAYAEAEIALLEGFAAQALIAMQNARLITEQREALEQQTATAEVLQVINANPGNLTPVFDAMLEKAMALCGADFGIMRRYDGQSLGTLAGRGLPAALAEYMGQTTSAPRPGAAPARALESGRPVHVLDVTTSPPYHAGDAGARAVADLGGARTMLHVPLTKDQTAVGLFTLYRQEVRGFTDQQIALLENFAAQAVIAMENARLLGDLRARTAELAARNSDFAERIGQQAATIDVLKVMSASPDDTQPVFDQIVNRARELCDAGSVALFEYDGALMHFRAFCNATAQSIAEWRSLSPERAVYADMWPMIPTRGSISARAILDGKVIHVADMTEIEDLDPQVRGVASSSQISIPLMREGKAIGVIAMTGKAKVGFTDSQVALLHTFAEQAVIAITSVATYRALRERTAELTRSVAELQALEEVLRAVNASLDLDTVLDTIISRAVRLSRADEGSIYEYDTAEEAFRLKAAVGMPEDRIAALHDRRIRLGETHIGRAAVLREPVHVSDIQADPSLSEEAKEVLRGVHAVLAVPLLREETVVGGLVIRRRSMGDFAPETVALLQTFAAQSVLAIENARLFQEAGRARAAAEAALSDLRRTQDRLVQTEKLASLGQLTAGIAHEIKNPLNFVNNFADLSAELLNELLEAVAPGRVTLDAALREEIDDLAGILQGNLAKIAQHGRRADSIVKNMLLHSRSGEGEARPVALNDLAAEALNLAFHGARAAQADFTITLEQDLDPAAGTVELFPQEITRVLLNLIGNGFYAARKRAAEAGDGVAPALLLATRDRGDSVEIRVRDNGSGIPPAIRERIFQPFFTTKPTGEGTGLGLSLSHDIVVKQHGGLLLVESEPGAFTEFVVTLPRRLRAAG